MYVYGNEGLMYTYLTKDATRLYREMVRSLAITSQGQVDDDISISVSRHNILAVAESFKWDYPLHKHWYSKARWGALVSQYLDKGAYELWLDSIENGLAVKKNARGIATLRTNMVAPRQSGRGLTRRWGSCILGFSYRQLPLPQITMHSRTSYLGYIGGLDISLAHCMAREVGERVGLPVEAMRFVWHLDAIQFHPMRSVGWMFYENEDQFLNFDPKAKTARQECPGVYHSRKWFDKWIELDEAGIPYADMAYNTMARFRRRYHTEILGFEYGEPFETPAMRRFKPIAHFRPADLVIHFSKRASRAEPDFDKVEVVS
jgi:hypothetical protein